MKKMTIKTILTLAALALLLTFTVSGTLAYISTSTGNVVNEFTPAKVTCAVSETFKDNTKTNVGVTNTGNTTAWIRAKVVGNWVDAEGKVVAPWTDDISYASGWTKGSDGFYYCNTTTDAGDTTSNLFASYTAGNAPVADAHLELTIVCQAVQENLGANGQAAFEKAATSNPAGN